MDRVFIYLLLALVAAGSCLLEYWGSRLLAPLAASTQNRIALVWVALCALALAAFHTNLVVSNCFVLSVALLAGALLGRQMGSVGALLAMLTVAAIVDVISTYAGPTRWIANQAQHAHGVALIQLLAVSVRLKGQRVGVIGLADLMFFTACVGAMRRLGGPETAVLFVPLFGILSAVAVGLFVGFLPALPFLAAAVILYAYVSGRTHAVGRNAAGRNMP